MYHYKNQTTGRGSIEQAVSWLSHYCADNATDWPWPDIHPKPWLTWLSRCKLIYREGANIFGNASYEAISQTAPSEVDYASVGLQMADFVTLLYPPSSPLTAAELPQPQPHSISPDDDDDASFSFSSSSFSSSSDSKLSFDTNFQDGMSLPSYPLKASISGSGGLPGTNISMIAYCRQGE